jgi:hypothetical protein
VQWLAERSNELEAERSKLDNHLSDLVGAIGKAAASDPHVVKALPELSSHLPPDLAKRLDTAVSYYFTDEPGDLPRTILEDIRAETPTDTPSA